MLIDEKFTIRSPLKEAWDFLLNPETVGPCIPGCETFEAVNDKEYKSVIAAKVGPIKVRFNIKTVIDEVEPHVRIHTVGEGKEIKNLGRFKQKTTLLLNELSADETEVSYRTEVSVVGRLATFGDRVLSVKASEIGKEFAKNINRNFQAQNAAPPEDSAPGEEASDDAAADRASPPEDAAMEDNSL
ncbi:MAG: hypothetical protein GY859_31600, partial [Desulfobacterales bacterium]|nr:hypothetical protein [Desulfobacterales bacterium]